MLKQLPIDAVKQAVFSRIAELQIKYHSKKKSNTDEDLVVIPPESYAE